MATRKVIKKRKPAVRKTKKQRLTLDEMRKISGFASGAATKGDGASTGMMHTLPS